MGALLDSIQDIFEEEEELAVGVVAPPPPAPVTGCDVNRGDWGSIDKCGTTATGNPIAAYELNDICNVQWVDSDNKAIQVQYNKSSTGVLSCDQSAIDSFGGLCRTGQLPTSFQQEAIDSNCLPIGSTITGASVVGDTCSVNFTNINSVEQSAQFTGINPAACVTPLSTDTFTPQREAG